MNKRLIVVQARGPAVEFPLKEGKNLVGRSDPDEQLAPDVDLEELDVDQKVSRRHALIVCTSHTATIRDLGSINGTSLRAGQLLEANQDYPIEHNAEFVIGNLLVRFEVG